MSWQVEIDHERLLDDQFGHSMSPCGVRGDANGVPRPHPIDTPNLPLDSPFSESQGALLPEGVSSTPGETRGYPKREQ